MSNSSEQMTAWSCRVDFSPPVALVPHDLTDSTRSSILWSSLGGYRYE